MFHWRTVWAFGIGFLSLNLSQFVNLDMAYRRHRRAVVTLDSAQAQVNTNTTTRARKEGRIHRIRAPTGPGF